QDEHGHRAADEQVLDRMDAYSAQHLDGGDADESERDEEQSVFGRPVAERIEAHRIDEGDAESLEAMRAGVARGRLGWRVAEKAGRRAVGGFLRCRGRQGV